MGLWQSLVQMNLGQLWPQPRWRIEDTTCEWLLEAWCPAALMRYPDGHFIDTYFVPVIFVQLFCTSHCSWSWTHFLCCYHFAYISVYYSPHLSLSYFWLLKMNSSFPCTTLWSARWVRWRSHSKTLQTLNGQLKGQSAEFPLAKIHITETQFAKWPVHERTNNSSFSKLFLAFLLSLSVKMFSFICPYLCLCPNAASALENLLLVNW